MKKNPSVSHFESRHFMILSYLCPLYIHPIERLVFPLHIYFAPAYINKQKGGEGGAWLKNGGVTWLFSMCLIVSRGAESLTRSWPLTHLFVSERLATAFVALALFSKEALWRMYLRMLASPATMDYFSGVLLRDYFLYFIYYSDSHFLSSHFLLEKKKKGKESCSFIVNLLYKLAAPTRIADNFPPPPSPL